MKHLKIVAPGFEAYTGNLGNVAFVDGLSVEPVPASIAARLSAAMRMTAVDVDGNEEDASVAHRLIADTNRRAPVVDRMELQTAADRANEEKADVIKSSSAPGEAFYSREELEALIDEKGIKGLREVGDLWSVKHRSASVLVDMILDRQTAFIEARDARIAAIEVEAAGEAGVEGEAEPVGEVDQFTIGETTYTKADIVALMLEASGTSADEFAAMDADTQTMLFQLQLDKLKA